MGVLSLLIISYKLLFFFYEFSYASDTLSSYQSLSDGKTLVSRDGTLELGFFSPGSNTNRYLGIWYKNIPDNTVVWVANRLNPINDSYGLLMINSTGNLLLMNQNKSVVWSANLRIESRGPVELQLLDSGNLVLREEQDSNLDTYLWQSFDYPSDAWLPEMKLGWNLKTRFEWRLSAWNSPDDPSPGDLTMGVELGGNPEPVMWKGSEKFHRGGPWNGLGVSGAPEFTDTSVFNLYFVFNEEEVYYKYNLSDESVIPKIILNQSRNLLEQFTWSRETQSWVAYSTLPRDRCDSYGLCGAYGICMLTELPICQCLEGFKYKLTDQRLDWSEGCVRNKPLNYSKLDGFIKFHQLKWPDTTHSWVNKSMNLHDCREKCLENSTCMAYTNFDVREGGTGCAMWFGDLIDIRMVPQSVQDLYIRMSSSELANKDEPERRLVVIIAIVIAVVAVVLIVAVGCHIRKRRNAIEKNENKKRSIQENGGKKEDMELPLFELATITDATNYFSINNKLGEGGFGTVYKGILAEGQEIAVKRLSKISGQGLNELKNEVILIAKLQHRNLVKLLGCCIQGEEKLLIYEFMPNKSLDYFIFEKTRKKTLDWSKRYSIICGIARGLLYLHQDSRLRIIHRDLKASNILLDHEMNPKISDFGLARTFGGDDIEGNTNRVVGTYGYMAPQYASDGLFSIKSDVFSFGILLLEIVSGKRNKGFYQADQSLSITAQAWKLWNEGNPLELLDSYIEEPSNPSLVMRCIHISLLCVQQRPDDRPGMSSVVLMLGSENALPQPKQPGFLIETTSIEPGSSPPKHESSSTNEITMSELDGR